MLKRPLQVNQQDDVQGRINQSQNVSILELQSIPLLNGLLIQNVALTSGDNLVPHGLARRPIGYNIFRTRNGAVSIYDKMDTQAEDVTRLVRLNASANGLVDIWIF